MAAIVCRKGNDRTIVAIPPNEATLFAPWSDENTGRLNELLSQDFASLLHSPLPERPYAAVKRRSWLRFRDLFSPRQLLVALEYAAAVRNVCSEMQEMHVPVDRINALSTYLAFFLGYLVDRNSMLCRWQWTREEAGTSLESVIAFALVFVERSPSELVEEWLSSVLPAIQTSASAPKAYEVYLGSASNLPYENDFFDAIVTDPPYYDRIPYTDLASFYWVWESGILHNITPVVPDSNAKETIEIKPGDDPDAYRQRLLAALREA